MSHVGIFLAAGVSIACVGALIYVPMRAAGLFGGDDEERDEPESAVSPPPYVRK